ncbi:molecular chaperone DnaK, partial [Nodosilinea sp. P-1105]|nr:molecular chaperone DnaK [Nodosilinea sp. P-1105]
MRGSPRLACTGCGLLRRSPVGRGWGDWWWGDGEMGRWGDGEMGRWGDGEMGRWGDGEMG